MITEGDVVNKYLGARYKHQGRSVEEGLDCWGLIVAIYRDLGFKVWDINADYDKRWSWDGKNYFMELYHKDWEPTDTPKLFDGVLFKSKRGVVNHAGVMLTNSRFIHAGSRFGVIVSRLYERHWKERLEGFYRLRARDES